MARKMRQCIDKCAELTRRASRAQFHCEMPSNLKRVAFDGYYSYLVLVSGFNWGYFDQRSTITTFDGGQIASGWLLKTSTAILRQLAALS
ncbi:hypothetical protein JCGZ_02419 [Jatropha curcas]|uniref:Uncharacterized protein n=1 Tax=Jatropha curcas TaxID=180498 RepID=A0A067LHW5_JATCU|nr:hypothetical protein JCGZ_02419 [Jatropha curcas]